MMKKKFLGSQLKKTKRNDLTSSEGEFGFKLHTSIDAYFNCYWFAELDGFINNYFIRLEPVLPNIELNSFESNLEGYINNHDRTGKIPIGIEGNGLIVIIDNVSGKIELEDFERGSFQTISDSLDKLIFSLRLQN